jgi:hypothetical protein
MLPSLQHLSLNAPRKLASADQDPKPETSSSRRRCDTRKEPATGIVAYPSPYRARPSPSQPSAQGHGTKTGGEEETIVRKLTSTVFVPGVPGSSCLETEMKRGASTPFESQTKKKKSRGDFASVCTVDVLGAVKGQVIRGVGEADERAGIVKAEQKFYNWVRGVVLEVATGGVKPQKEARDRARATYGDDGWAEQLGKAWSISTSRAQTLIDLMEGTQSIGEEGYLGVAGSLVSAGNGQVHVVAGEEVTFRILEPGAWGIYDNVVSLVDSGEAVSPGRLYDELLEGKKRNGEGQELPGPFALQRFLFVQAASSGAVEHREGDRVDVEVCGFLAPNEPAVYYDVSAELESDGTQQKLRVKLPPSRADRFAVDEAKAFIHTCADALLTDQRYHYRVKSDAGDGSVQHVGLLDGLNEARAASDIELVFGVLTAPSIGAGALKSLLQKSLRYGAKETDLPAVNGDSARVDTRIVVLVCVALLYTIKSSFMPDLGLHVRGCTNASKRVAVIMVEDAWPRMGLLRGLSAINGGRANQFDPGSVLSALMGVALATSRVATYEPPDSVVFASMLVAVACHQSDEIIDWRAKPVPVGSLTTRANQAGMRMAARLLRIVRSFGGDMDMLDTAARLTSDDGKVRVLATGNDPVGVMPLRHMIDQHVWRGMGFTTVAGGATFKQRHRTMFRDCTGWNPRLSASGAMLDESSPVVTTVRNQQRMIETLLFPPSAATMDVDASDTPLSVPLDRGVLAAGVGPIGPLTVFTSRDENLVDGYPKESGVVWKLLVILGVDTDDEIVMHTVNARDNDKKPIITKTAKQKAIAEARTGRYPFSSPVLPGYTQVAFSDDERWTIYPSASAAATSGLEPIAWSYGAVQTSAVPYTLLPRVPDSLMDNHDPASVLAVLNGCLSVKTAVPGLSVAYKESIQRALDALAARAHSDGLSGRTLQLRLLAMIRGKYTEVALPTPDKDGGLGSDQLLAMDGDWLVYLTLLKIARVAPGALQLKMAPKFSVGDSRLLRVVEMIVADHLASNPNPQWKATFTTALSGLKGAFGTAAIGGREPFDYQTALVNKMLARDATAVVKPRGHFVSLDTGLGKSITAALYMLEYGVAYGNAARVVWFTPNNVVETALVELQTTWGLGARNVGKVDTKAPSLNKLINIVPIGKLSVASRGALETALTAAAETSFAVVDEVHLSYNVSIRTSTIRSFVEACPRFVCMTATPTPGRAQVVGEQWIADSVGFPLTKANFLVGAAQMVAAKVELPIEAEERILPVSLNAADAAEHMRFLRDGGQWAEAAAHVRKATFDAMAAKIVELADEDRAANPGGGVLVFMDNETEAEAMRAMLASVVALKDYAVGLRAGNETNGLVGIAVTTKRDTSGYNFVRMGAIVTGVYAESAASRHQLRGRIRRIGQTRAKVSYWTVYPRNTILSMLFERHNSVDAKNASLEQLAAEFFRKNA